MQNELPIFQGGIIISCIYFVMIRLIVITEVDIDIAYEKHSNYFWQRKLQSCTEYSYIEENWLIIPHWWRIILAVKMKVPSSSSSKLPYRLPQNIILARSCRWEPFLWWNLSRNKKLYSWYKTIRIAKKNALFMHWNYHILCLFEHVEKYTTAKNIKHILIIID